LFRTLGTFRTGQQVAHERRLCAGAEAADDRLIGLVGGPMSVAGPPPDRHGQVIVLLPRPVPLKLKQVSQTHRTNSGLDYALHGALVGFER
jgi:hypothetical protein